MRAESETDPLPRYELDQIAPVRSDVGEGPGRPAGLGVDAPVVIVGPEQPVLQIPAVEKAQVAEAGVGAGAGLANGRVVAVGEGDRRDQAGVARRVGEAGGAGGVERDRLFDDDVLAGRDRGERERQVQVVRGADVDDVDRLGGDQLLGAAEATCGADLGSCIGASLGRRGRDSGEIGAGEEDGAGVDAADETRCR